MPTGDTRGQQNWKQLQCGRVACLHWLALLGARWSALTAGQHTSSCPPAPQANDTKFKEVLGALVNVDCWGQAKQLSADRLKQARQEAQVPVDTRLLCRAEGETLAGLHVSMLSQRHASLRCPLHPTRTCRLWMGACSCMQPAHFACAWVQAAEVRRRAISETAATTRQRWADVQAKESHWQQDTAGRLQQAEGEAQVMHERIAAPGTGPGPGREEGCLVLRSRLQALVSRPCLGSSARAGACAARAAAGAARRPGRPAGRV